MAASLQGFLDGFVLPLLERGAVRLRSPLSVRDMERFRGDLGLLDDTRIALGRMRRARRLVSSPPLGSMDESELSYWMGLHNLVFFDHPQLGQVWASDAKWTMVEKTTAAFLDRGYPDSAEQIVARDVALSALAEVRRVDHVLLTREGEHRYLGQPVPRRLGLFDAVGYEQRTERVRWLTAPHASPTTRILPRAFRGSPLTSLLYAEDVSPAASLGAMGPLLARPDYARAVVYAWSRASRWDLLGARVMERLLVELGLGPGSSDGLPEREEEAGRPPSTGDGGDLGEVGALPTELALPGAEGPPVAVLGALLHLHVLKVLEMRTRVGLSAPEKAVGWRLFFGLPLLMTDLSRWLGTPDLSALGSELEGRWEQYKTFVRGIVPPHELRWMRRTLLPALTEGIAA